MNTFWIGLILIIIFLLYQYRNLEIRYKRVIDNEKQDFNKKKILNKIIKIEKDLNTIKKELINKENDA
jgi:hypothetical protein